MSLGSIVDFAQRLSESFFSAGFVAALGWTLVHFIWQGMLLALSLFIFVAYSRRAATRYWAAVITLAIMVAAPALTFWVIWHTSEPGSAAAYTQINGNVAALGSTQNAHSYASAIHSLSSVNWLACFATIWFLGVLAFALRAVGAWILVERFYRKNRQILTPFVAARCAALQQRLGITRKVQFFLSTTIDAPAVVGWFRPIILLPVTALTALSPEQLEAIIVHELAHIQRLDCFVNLFQIAAETLLFYHPAVWWVSRMIRAERENCCDDVAVAVCGDIGVYARALTLVETWRGMPALVVAANSSSLKLRIERLLGIKTMTSNISCAGIAAVSLICVSGALLAGGTFRQTSRQTSSAPVSTLHITQETIAPVSISTHPVVTVALGDLVVRASAEPVLQSAPAAQANSKPSPAPAQTPSDEASPNASSYIEGLRAAGLKNLDVNQLIALKVQGVTPQFIRDIHSAGLTPTVGEIIGMRVQGVTPEFIRKVRENWPDTSIGEIIGMKVQGVGPADATAYRNVGLEKLNVGQLIAFRVHGITPEYVKSLQAAGLKDLNAGSIIGAKVQGITPEFVQKVRAHGFADLTLHQLIALKNAGAF